MTPMEPKAKRMFDLEKFRQLCKKIDEPHFSMGEYAKNCKAVEDFIDSEIKRNVREFADNAKAEFQDDKWYRGIEVKTKIKLKEIAT
jgi:hypothetical protein